MNPISRRPSLAYLLSHNFFGFNPPQRVGKAKNLQSAEVQHNKLRAAREKRERKQLRNLRMEGKT